MKIYDSFQLFWNDHSQIEPSQYGFDDWTIVRFRHIDDRTFSVQKNNGSDELGFQPLWITLANPHSKSTREVLIKDVDDELASRFLQHSKESFYTQLGKRFGSFRPDEIHALAEYDNWESFSKIWLERNGKSVLNHNIPLLFDHTPKIEYWTRKQTGLEVLPYQRLLLTTYFVPKNEILDLFI